MGQMDPAFEKRLREACAAAPEACLAALGSRPGGLDEAAAEAGLREFGPNVLAGEKRKSALLDILFRFKDPLAIILLVICLVSFLTGDLASGFMVLAMIFISVFLSFFQERRSSAAAQKLK